MDITWKVFDVFALILSLVRLLSPSLSLSLSREIERELFFSHCFFLWSWRVWTIAKCQSIILTHFKCYPEEKKWRKVTVSHALYVNCVCCDMIWFHNGYHKFFGEMHEICVAFNYYLVSHISPWFCFCHDVLFDISNNDVVHCVSCCFLSNGVCAEWQQSYESSSNWLALYLQCTKTTTTLLFVAVYCTIFSLLCICALFYR